MSPSSPFITVVIPVYNRERIVMRTLESIEAQTSKNFRLVLVDNNSTDSTLEVISGWASKPRGFEVVIVSEKTPGAAAARNRGLLEVTTPWVMFFDSDDVMLPRHIERAEEQIRSNPDADVIGWDISFADAEGRIRRLGFPRRDFAYCNIHHYPFSSQRFCCMTNLVRKAGGWDPEVFGWNDIELASRILRHARKVVHAGGELTVRNHFTPESITGTSFSSGLEKFDFSIDRIKFNLPEGQRHWAELKRVVLAANCYREGAKGEAVSLLGKAMAGTPSRFHRFLWSIAWHYTRIGGRGISRILRPFI